MSNFQSLEVVDRGSKTQPRVVENLNKLIKEDNNLFEDSMSYSIYFAFSMIQCLS